MSFDVVQWVYDRQGYWWACRQWAGEPLPRAAWNTLRDAVRNTPASTRNQP